jgi:hypothetical protein
MKKNLLLVIFLLGTKFLKSQDLDSQLVIQPNIIISYNSQVFKIDWIDRVENGVPDRASFRRNSASPIKRIFDVIGQDSNNLYTGDLDSSMLEELHTYLKREKDIIQVVECDTAIKHINGFSCYGIIFYYKENKEYRCYIIGRRYTGNENMDFRFQSSAKSKLKDEYKVVKLFTRGISFKK